MDNKTSDITVVDVRFEHLRDAFGVGVARPRLSWIIESAAGDWRQAGLLNFLGRLGQREWWPARHWENVP